MPGHGSCPLLAVWGSRVRVPLGPPVQTALRHALESTFDDNSEDNLSSFASVDIVRRKQRAHRVESAVSRFSFDDTGRCTRGGLLFGRLCWRVIGRVVHRCALLRSLLFGGGGSGRASRLVGVVRVRGAATVLSNGRRGIAGCGASRAGFAFDELANRSAQLRVQQATLNQDLG